MFTGSFLENYFDTGEWWVVVEHRALYGSGGGRSQGHRGLMVEKTTSKAFTILPRDMDPDFCPATSVISMVASMACNKGCA